MKTPEALIGRKTSCGSAKVGTLLQGLQLGSLGAWEPLRDGATPCLGSRAWGCGEQLAGGGSPLSLWLTSPRTFLNTLVGSNLHCHPSHSLGRHRQHGHVNAKRKKPIAFDCSTSIREHAKTSPTTHCPSCAPIRVHHGKSSLITPIVKMLSLAPPQIVRNDSASDMLELDERLGASWQSASASAACIEKPKVAARYCA